VLLSAHKLKIAAKIITAAINRLKAGRRVIRIISWIKFRKFLIQVLRAYLLEYGNLS